MGTFSTLRARTIVFPEDFEKKWMIQVIPIIGVAPQSCSQTKIIGGLIEEYDFNICGFQHLPSVNRFYLREIPLDTRFIYAMRKNELTGQSSRLQKLSCNFVSEYSGQKQNKDNILHYTDSGIGNINSIYSYDFFSINRFGLEKHLIQKTVRIYEKDTLGHKVLKRKSYRNETDAHVLELTLKYPEPFLPKNIQYSLYNPDDDFFEACRNQKRVCTLKITRHSDDGKVQPLGIHVLNPGELNTLDAKINDKQNFEVSLTIDRAFLNRYDAEVPWANRTYYYEVRLGSYALGNELSFLKQPLKITVPNEYTDGKTGYSYHPYIFETPSRKDYALHGRLGTSKNILFEESLTSTSATFILEPSEVIKVGNFTLKAKLARVNKSGSKHAVVITATFSDLLLNTIDHVELFVADTTTGIYVSLGKHMIRTKEFYFIDTESSKLACNRLKYKIVGRGMNFDNIFSAATELIDISETNKKITGRGRRPGTHTGKMMNRKIRGL